VLEDYYASLDQRTLPLSKSLVMTRDDQVRKAAIHDLLCQSVIAIPKFEAQWGLSFSDYFEADLAALRELENDGLVTISDQEIRITPRGRFLARIVAMRFDRYLRETTTTAKYSRVI